MTMADEMGKAEKEREEGKAGVFTGGSRKS
jgi:hypothetical protein